MSRPTRPTRPTRPHRLLAALALLLACGACRSPVPPANHLTRLWPVGETGTPLLGVSTEDGIVMLSDPQYTVGDVFDIQFPYGNSMVRDRGVVDRLNDNVAVVRPLSARLLEGRFSDRPPMAADALFLALRSDADEVDFAPVKLWGDGAYGDWITFPEGTLDWFSGSEDLAEVARTRAGSGVYRRTDTQRMVIVGLLSGFTASLGETPDAQAMGYIGLEELARILPDSIPYYKHWEPPLRPDFEYGVPLKPGDVIVRPPDDEIPSGGGTPQGGGGRSGA